MPAKETVIAVLDDEPEMRKALRRLLSCHGFRVEEFERAEAARRALTGERVLGRYAVLRQSVRKSPRAPKPRRGLRPTIAARSLWARLEAIQRKRDFVAAYRKARAAFRAGLRIAFPYGTYWLHRFMGIEVEPGHVGASNLEALVEMT